MTKPDQDAEGTGQSSEAVRVEEALLAGTQYSEREIGGSVTLIFQGEGTR